MMRWGKKNDSKSSSSSSKITHVLPTWLKKLKLKSGSVESKTAKTKPRKEVDETIDELYWTVPFGDENVEKEKRRGGVSSISCDFDDEIEVVMASCGRWRSRSRSEGDQGFNGMVLEIGKTREMQYKEGIMQGKPLNEQAVKDQELRKQNRKVQDFQMSKTTDTRRQRSLSCPGNNLTTIKEDCAFESLESEDSDAFSDEEDSSDRRKLKDSKIKERISTIEQQRKSVYISRTKAYSPRTRAKSECKIKALEDMKKAKRTMRKKTKATGVVPGVAFNSYAVVKSSFNPQQDFRDSMLEMIIEKGIQRPQELEELLVCYLTLNCDEYHDLIIKVFRQVWFELNQVYYDLDSQNHCI